MNLIAELEAQNDRYWRVRNRVKTTQEKARRHDVLRTGRIACRKETSRLLSTGFLVKKSCEVCGEEKVDVHHTDYNDPVNVMFLCRKHHNEWHAKHGVVSGGEYFL